MNRLVWLKEIRRFLEEQSDAEYQQFLIQKEW